MSMGRLSEYLSAFHDGVGRMTLDRYVKVLSPFYSGDVHYVRGTWNGFLVAPWAFCLNRAPQKPGRALFAELLRLGGLGAGWPESHVIVHPPSEPCAWSQDERTGAWETACGGAFLFAVDGPAENGYNFCPACGRPLDASASLGVDSRS